MKHAESVLLRCPLTRGGKEAPYVPSAVAPYANLSLMTQADGRTPIDDVFTWAELVDSTAQIC